MRAAIKKILKNAFVCPIHDRPAKVERGKVVGRFHDSVPGAMTPQVETATAWVPATQRHRVANSN